MYSLPPYMFNKEFPSCYKIYSHISFRQRLEQILKKKIKKIKRLHGLAIYSITMNEKYYLCDAIRVLIGFSFKPMLSGERSSGAIQVGLSGLLGLPLN